MKRLVCEMCGSSDIIKQEGLFVCQSCGTKYSVEEAKKMMVEGTVRIDNTHMIENYLEMADNAYASGNSTEAESYCNKIIEIDPTNYKVFLLSISEVNKYLKLNASRRCSATAYAKAQGSDFYSSWWWLRSPGIDSAWAALVYCYDGSIDYSGIGVHNGFAVRPALWIDLGF